MELNEKLENLVLKKQEDITILDNLLDEVKRLNYPKNILISLLNVIERNPQFRFGMPGNIVRCIENYYKDPNYEGMIISSIECIPTEYNLWLLNRLLNSYENEIDKVRGVNLLKKVRNETTDEYIKEIAQDFLKDYEN